MTYNYNGKDKLSLLQGISKMSLPSAGGGASSVPFHNGNDNLKRNQQNNDHFEERLALRLGQIDNDIHALLNNLYFIFKSPVSSINLHHGLELLMQFV